METTKRIIIIDDDENICKSLSLILKNVGYITDTAMTGNDAISKIRQEFFNVALLDIKLPDVEGIEILTSIKEINPDIEIIMITGEASIESAIMALNKEASAYLRKPLQPEDLLNHVKNLLEKQSLTISNRELEQKLRESEKNLKKINQELKQNFEAQKETNQLLDSVLDNTHIAIAYLDPKFNFLRVNRSYAEADERDISFFLGKNHFDLFPNTENEEIFQRAVKTGEPYFAYAKPFKYTEHPERRISYWDWSLIPIKDSVGMIEGLVLTLQNVTEAKKAEQKLRDSEEIWRSMTENSPDYILTLDKELIIQFINRSANPSLSFDDIIGKSVYDFIPAKNQKLAKQCFEQVLSSKKSDRYNSDFTYDDGITHNFESRVGPILKEGEIDGFIVSCTDVTERKRTENALLKSEERLKSFMGSATEGFIIYDSELNLLEINDSALKILNMNKEDMVGKPMLELSPGLKKTGRYEMYLNVVKTGKPFHAEDIIPHSKYGDICLSVRTFKVGEGLGVIFNDVTERKNVENELRTSEKKLKEILEVIPIGVSISTPEGEMLEVNSYAFKVFGYNTKEEFLRVLALDHYYDPKDRDRFVKLNEKGYVKDFKSIFKRKDGTLMWGAVNSITQKIEDQTVFLNVFQDISERIKAEEEIADLARFPSENPSPVLRISEEFVIYVNNVGQNLFKIKEGNRIPILLRDIAKKAFEEYNSQQMEVKLDNHFYSLVINPVKDAGYANIYGMNVNELKQTELRLRESEKQYSQILNSMIDAIHVVDKDLRIIMMNPAFKQWLKKLNIDADLSGQKIYEAFPFLSDKVINEYKKVLATEKTLYTEESTILNDIEIFTETTKIPIISNDNVIQIITIISDITDRKRMEEN